MQYAGNRRADLHRVPPVLGDPWSRRVGNAVWTGVLLADVLRAACAETSPALLVALDACDTTATVSAPRSIPMTKALHPEVLLAFAINGEPLAPEHGFP